MARSSRGPGRLVLSQEIRGSNPLRATPSFPGLTAALFAAGLVGICAAAAETRGYGPPRVAANLQGADLAEVSGLAAGIRRPNLLYAHNDSGDAPRMFALNLRGETVTTIVLRGAEHVDWEDMAAGRDASGRPRLHVGDIGDNAASRPHVTLYSLDEPALVPANAPLEAAVTRVDLIYPDGPRDAEALLVHPATGRTYLITKSLKEAGLYAVPRQAAGKGPHRLQKLGALNLQPFPATIRRQQDALSRLLVTGAAFSPDGRRVAIRTYTDAYEWSLPATGDPAAILTRSPRHIPLPEQPQGETIAYAAGGDGLLTVSEGARQPLFLIPAVGAGGPR